MSVPKSTEEHQTRLKLAWLKRRCRRRRAAELAKRAKRARVWGSGARFPGQEVGLAHRLEHGDLVEILDH